MTYDVQIAIDAADPHALAEWWADLLGWEYEPQDEDFIRRMIAEGHASEDDTTTHRGKLVWRAAAINHPGGRESGRPRILFQEVPEPKTVKNRIHLDLRPGEGDPDKEVLLRRALEKGAKELWRANEGPHEWITVADPEGNELCLN
jgi:hypothetical protein